MTTVQVNWPDGKEVELPVGAHYCAFTLIPSEAEPSTLTMIYYGFLSLVGDMRFESELFANIIGEDGVVVFGLEED